MKQRTIQELIEALNVVNEYGNIEYSEYSYLHNCISMSLTKLQAKHEEELKEAVIKAVWYGHDEKPEMIHVSEDFAEQYYNENHKPN